MFVFLKVPTDFLPACADPLGMESYDIPNFSLLSSSGSGAYNARLNSPNNLYLLPQEDEYVQVDLGPGGKTVTAVVLQGYFSYYNKGWISKLTLNISRDGREFSSYVENSVTKVSNQGKITSECYVSCIPFSTLSLRRLTISSLKLFTHPAYSRLIRFISFSLFTFIFHVFFSHCNR